MDRTPIRPQDIPQGYKWDPDYHAWRHQVLPPIPRVDPAGTANIQEKAEDLVADPAVPKTKKVKPVSPLDKLSAAITSGLARTNRYEVFIYPPPILDTAGLSILSKDSFAEEGSYRRLLPDTSPVLDSTNITRRLTFTCETASLPGRGVAVKEARTYGPMRKFAWDQSYSELSLTFMVGQDMLEKRFFEAWQQSVFDPVTHNMNYYNEYVSTIEIFQNDTADNRVYGVQIFEAYPTLIGDLSLSYADTDNFHKLPITITYRKWLELQTA